MSKPNPWKEKNVGVMKRRGTSKRQPVIDERDGTVGGYQTTHWDDSQDAEVNLKPVEGFKEVPVPDGEEGE